ncbi:hypothetical protein Taro_048831 [Colocasia esculenta]|uniref:Uncharacterized protein n=1 Tax=Colocasia esculenta TaxID=4460 RepID=A0A843X991_COLES|nr:hypothetical protein [Colocasia esculenta]
MKVKVKVRVSQSLKGKMRVKGVSEYELESESSYHSVLSSDEDDNRQMWGSAVPSRRLPRSVVDSLGGGLAGCSEDVSMNVEGYVMGLPGKPRRSCLLSVVNLPVDLSSSQSGRPSVEPLSSASGRWASVSGDLPISGGRIAGVPVCGLALNRKEKGMATACLHLDSLQSDGEVANLGELPPCSAMGNFYSLSPLWMWLVFC